ncbi:MAG TPA: hypothetical protein VHZ03_38140 [Trebonia sp.]|jgi:hypothetical protein|nr:hypothetical protein [Trebonia sp.]
MTGPQYTDPQIVRYPGVIMEFGVLHGCRPAALTALERFIGGSKRC